MDNLTSVVQLNAKYRMVFERAASTKGTIGYKVEANGDDLSLVVLEARDLKEAAEKLAGAVANG